MREIRVEISDDLYEMIRNLGRKERRTAPDCVAVLLEGLFLGNKEAEIRQNIREMAKEPTWDGTKLVMPAKTMPEKVAEKVPEEISFEEMLRREQISKKWASKPQ